MLWIIHRLLLNAIVNEARYHSQQWSRYIRFPLEIRTDTVFSMPFSYKDDFEWSIIVSFIVLLHFVANGWSWKVCIIRQDWGKCKRFHAVIILFSAFFCNVYFVFTCLPVLPVRYETIRLFLTKCDFVFFKARIVC